MMLGDLSDHLFHFFTETAVFSDIDNDLDRHLLRAGILSFGGFVDCSLIDSSAFSSPPKPITLFGIPKRPKNTSDSVLRGAGVIVGSSMEPLMLKLATRKEFLMAAIPRPTNGM